jgi:polyisoprenoid-binding protein YceI
MHADVLRTQRYPKGAFFGTASAEGDGFRVSGELELAGRRAPLAFDVKRRGDTYSAEFELAPSRWGIAQYKALLGAIRLKDRVRVQVELTESAT